ncbi:PIG-L deacetylase family protein [Actinokineospora sp. G85]|uniref:PIG-L deacetylase family protein n=1 Tax=Actinokineospora sp. G85 TaxID=3406626 RepID=UPI003C73D02E
MAETALLLSPHPDDVAWSLGGAVRGLADAGVVLVARTFFGTTRYAPGHPAHGTLEAVEVRAGEEDAWAAWAGVRLTRHDLPDASLRGYTDETEMGAEPAAEVVDSATALLGAALDATAPDLVLAPLAVGGHVDHAAVRQAVLRLAPATPVVWYEDLPYADGRSEAYAAHAVTVDLGARWAAKATGVHHFPSQLPGEVLPVLHRHGERLWTDDAASAALLTDLLAGSLVAS